MDNKLSLQQSKGMTIRSHNYLSRSDLERLYKSPSISKINPSGYQTRLIFNIALVTAMRTSSLANLEMKQFVRLMADGKPVWWSSGVIGSRNGSSQNTQSGLRAVGDKPVQIKTFAEDSIDGILNFYKDIDDYMLIREYNKCDSPRFILAYNPRAKKTMEFFKNQNLGRNIFSRIVADACSNESITGVGCKDAMTTHGLIATVTTTLIEQGHSDASITMRTGHRCVESLKSCSNLNGAIGRLQQRAIFGASVAKKRKVETTSVGNENPTMEHDGDGDPSTSILTASESDGTRTGTVSAPSISNQVSPKPPQAIEPLQNLPGSTNQASSVFTNLQQLSGCSFNVTINHHHHYR